MEVRGQRWLAVSILCLLVVGLGAAAVAQLPPGGTFVDDDGNIHEPNIEAIATAGYTAGCNPPANDRYCPAKAVTRAEMAAFLLRMMGESGNLPNYQGYFTDVPAGQWYTGYVERLFELGLTTGYGDGRYGPGNTVTRAEMAAFLLRVKGEAPNAAFKGYFADVSSGVWYAGYVERVYELGITSGCNKVPLAYCPNAPVLRDQMATFLANTAGLDPIVPTPPTSSTTTTTTTVVPSGGTFENPWPIGTEAPFGGFYSEEPGWMMRIDWVRADGYEMMMAECLSQGVSASTCEWSIAQGPDNVSLMVHMTFTRIGARASNTPSYETFRLTTPRGLVRLGACYATWFIPDHLDNVHVSPGETVSGNTCWTVSPDDLGQLRLSGYKTDASSSSPAGPYPPFFGPF